jgi:hypothetical protein
LSRRPQSRPRGLGTVRRSIYRVNGSVQAAASRAGRATRSRLPTRGRPPWCPVVRRVVQPGIRTALGSSPGAVHVQKSGEPGRIRTFNQVIESLRTPKLGGSFRAYGACHGVPCVHRMPLSWGYETGVRRGVGAGSRPG